MPLMNNYVVFTSKQAVFILLIQMHKSYGVFRKSDS